MKNRILTLALALVMCLSLVPMTAFAADDALTISDLEVVVRDDQEYAHLEFTIKVPASIQGNSLNVVDCQYSIDGDEWKWIMADAVNGEIKDGARIATDPSADFDISKNIKVQAKITGGKNGEYWTNDWSNVLTLNEKVDLITSDWAKSEIEKADALGLIPDSLKGQDLTKPITRAEFAAVSVKVYEALSGVKAIPAVNNPFTDTKDVEVLKAYNTNLMIGTAADKFSPDVLLNREQAATALTRVFKRVTLPGWTFATDSQFTLFYTKPDAFADDAKISDWAKDSVYFMAANGIISGTGNNNFSPKATTADEEARGYAQATREQALAIAVRMVEKLGV